jgi:F-type H+-transporting ATPase subunit b
MSALGINLGLLIFQILNFTVVMILLYAWAYRPILNMLKRRQETITKGIEDAQVAAEARAHAEEEAREIITKAHAEAAEKVREATERAEVASLEVRAQAEGEASKAREAALAEVAGERERILLDVRGQVAALAIAAAQKLVGEALDERRQHALIDEFFSGIQSGKVVILEETEMRGTSAEITSALPLSDQEKETIRRDVISKIGSQTVTFRVDTAVLGGLVIRVGDKVMDGSVAGQLNALRQSLV